MYTQDLRIPDHTGGRPHLRDCCARWILTKRLQIPTLQNAVVQLMFTKPIMINRSAVDFVYTEIGFERNNKWRTLLVDRAVLDSPEDELEARQLRLAGQRFYR